MVVGEGEFFYGEDGILASAAREVRRNALPGQHHFFYSLLTCLRTYARYYAVQVTAGS